MTGQVIRKAIRVAVALVLAANLSGCVSVSVDTRKAADPKAAGGALEVAVSDTPTKAPVQTSLGATWSLGDVQPGKYRLHLKAMEPGSAPSAAPTIRKEDIQIKAGEVVRTEMILKKFPVLTVVCVAVGVGAIAGVLAWYSSNWFKGGTFQLSHAKKPLVTLAPATRTGRDPETARPTRRRAG